MLGREVRIVARIATPGLHELWFEIEGYGRARRMTVGVGDNATLSVPAHRTVRKVRWNVDRRDAGVAVASLRFDGCDPDDQGFCAAARLRAFGVSQPTGRLALIGAKLRLLTGLGIVRSLELGTGREIPATPRPAGSLQTGEPASPAVEAACPSCDITIILLDAARADRFGCYGYANSLTPFADRLSRRGTLFTHPYAGSPYTAASVPTLLTGLPTAIHGVIDPSLRLSEKAVTLAEILKTKGYKTITLSQSPNHSRAHGEGQGVDTFVELFRKPKRDAYDPFAIAKAAAKAAPGTAPLNLEPRRKDSRLPGGRFPPLSTSSLFLMAHFIAPHEPYEPGSPWRELAGIPAESRIKIRGNVETLRRLDQASAPTGEIAAIATLYEANLMRADSAVASLLHTLRARRPSRPSLAILLADHGEAFHEHGRMGHNSTIYDEMLHIPLILSRNDAGTGAPAPRSRHPLDNRMASLKDIFPTLVPGEARNGNGRNLLAPKQEDRTLLLRTAGLPVIRGVRTDRYKLIRQGAATTELYDLKEDPAERRNLALDRHDLALSLHQALRARFQAQHRRRLPALPAEDDAAAKAALRALGYLQ